MSVPDAVAYALAAGIAGFLVGFLAAGYILLEFRPPRWPTSSHDHTKEH